MKIIILTPMEIEQQKVMSALSHLKRKKHEYEVVVTGIGRESIAKAFMHLPPHDVCVLMGFAAIVGKQRELPAYLALGKPIEITEASLYGFEGGQFENGKPISCTPQLQLPCLSSLTSDKFIRTTDLNQGIVVNMEDYTFMFLKKPQDCIVRIVSDYLPHEQRIDFFEEVKTIQFSEALEALESALEFEKV